MRNLPPATRPSTAINPQELEISSQLPKLLSAIEEEETFQEDKYQAQVAVGWLHWSVGEYSLASVRLPKADDLDQVLAVGGGTVADWTRVCALKSAYLRANCLARNGKRTEALNVFESGLPCLTKGHSQQPSRQQLRYWSELFLTEYCMLFSHALDQGEVSLEDANCLASFRSWARYWEGSRGKPLPGGYGFRGSVPRRRIWFEYYSILSSILEDDLPFPTAYVPNISNESSARNQLRMELKKVEAIYEALLLDETEFPRADEERQEVEAFVSLVMQNWAILKGRGWRDQDIGQGGKESLSRGVLEVLYRASMKTYHSTSILRNLFTVHLAVAEFDLAFKAFDSYYDLMQKGKARVAKTGHQEPSLDEDATVLETMSLCITALCRYGDRQAAEKARDLSLDLEKSIDRLTKVVGDQDGSVSPLQEGKLALTTAHADFPPRVLALGWQSVGLAHAQWARMTYDSTVRTEIQSKAVRCLRKSLSTEYGRSANLRGVFALSILLAERRELAAAIELVRTALLSGKPTADNQELYNGTYWRERSLIPLWHLLALLLSARQDYVMASRACEGAFEQFKDPAVLFGTQHLYRSDHLNEAEATNEKDVRQNTGIVDEMDDYEKEAFLEVKMTQLALLELLEGPKVAVNASLELLSLFTRLFGNWQAQAPQPPPKTGEAPKSSAGTLRSIRGSLFGRNKDSRPGTKYTVNTTVNEKMETIQSRPQTTQTVASTKAPTIQVTKENGTTDDTRRPRRSGNQSERRSQSGKRHSLRKRDSSGERRRAVSSGGEPRGPTIVDGESFYTPFGSEGYSGMDFFQFANKRTISSTSSHGPPVSLSRQISAVESMSSGRSLGAQIDELASEGIEPTASLMPLIQFSRDHENRRRTAILVKVWLMVAGFYRRAGMLDDAKGAAAEAHKLVQGLEAEVAKDSSGTVSLRDSGWAGGRSVEQLWGDVWAEVRTEALCFRFLCWVLCGANFHSSEGQPVSSQGLSLCCSL